MGGGHYDPKIVVTQVWQIDDFWVTFEKIAPSLWGGAIFPKVTQGFEICATVTPPTGGAIFMKKPVAPPLWGGDHTYARTAHDHSPLSALVVGRDQDR